MTQRHRDDQTLAMLDTLIEETTADAHGDEETLWAFRQAFENHIVVPRDAFVAGEPVSVLSFDCDGNARASESSVLRADQAVERAPYAETQPDGSRCLDDDEDEDE